MGAGWLAGSPGECRTINANRDCNNGGGQWARPRDSEKEMHDERTRTAHDKCIFTSHVQTRAEHCSHRHKHVSQPCRAVAGECGPVCKRTNLWQTRNSITHRVTARSARTRSRSRFHSNWNVIALAVQPEGDRLRELNEHGLMHRVHLAACKQIWSMFGQ